MSKVFSDFESDSDSNTDLKLDNKKQYANSTQEKYYWHIGIDPALQWKSISDLDKTVYFLYGFFAWRCDICHGKNETVSGLCKETIRKVEDVIALVAREKELELTGRPKKNMYIEDVAEFARVLLTTMEMTFACGWQRIQMLFFCQLAAYTASRPGALLHLRYRDIGLKLIRDPEGGQPRLFIFLKPDFTKRFLGKKAPNEFKIPEIIFDPSLVLSPHVCLLSMLFHIQGFKRLSKTGPVLDSPEKLYSLRVLDGLGQQELLLKDELSDKFVFCQVEREPTRYQIILEKKLTAAMLGSRLRRGGEITGFDQVTHPYNLRYAGAKAFNNSGEVTDALQNVILQHADIRTFVRHYEVDVDVDVQGIVRKTESQTPLVRFACSFNSAEESKSLNKLPAVLARQEKVNKRKQKWEDCKAKLQHANMAASHCGEDCKPDLWLQKKLELLEDRTMEAKRRYNIAIRELRNEKQRQRSQRIRENLKCYRNEQPVINVKRQLAGKLVNTKVMNTLEHKSSMAPQHLAVINALLTMPGTTLEAECQRRIDAINALTAFCPVEEGRPIPRTNQSCRRPVPDDDDEASTPVKRQRQVLEDDTKIALRQAMEFVKVKDQRERPTTCFLCLGNPNLPLKERTAKHKTPGSLTRHFLRKHINRPWPARGVECNVCGIMSLEQKADLLNHAELCHGTVVRGRAQGELAQACKQATFLL
ncbi:hypothetical protein BDW72DRAFT_205428 [Aspergillus terricola var. indicus]